MPATTGGSESGRATRMRRRARPPRAGQKEGGGDAEEEVDAEGHQTRAQRQAEGVASLRGREGRAEGGPVDAPQHEGQGQDQEAQGERAEAPAQTGRGLTAGVLRDFTRRCYFAAGVKPALSRTF